MILAVAGVVEETILVAVAAGLLISGALADSPEAAADLEALVDLAGPVVARAPLNRSSKTNTPSSKRAVFSPATGASPTALWRGEAIHRKPPLLSVVRPS